jgi:hypothetical protein
MSDFSCYITIDNTQNKYPLQLVSARNVSGNWEPVSPPQQVAAGACIYFQLRDPAGDDGSQGSCVYSTGENNDVSISVSFADPTGSDSNEFAVECSGAGFSTYTIASCGISGNCVTGNGPDRWYEATPNGVPGSGHPVSGLVQVFSTNIK